MNLWLVKLYLILGCFFDGEENRPMCKFNGWVHVKCIEELKNYNEEELGNLKYACAECKEEFGDPFENNNE